VIFQILAPKKLKDLTNYIFGGTFEMSRVAEIGTTIAIFYAIAFVLNLVQSIIMPFLTAFVVRRMRGQISHKINRLPMRYFKEAKYGDILSRISNDVDNIANALNQSLATIVTAITMFFGTLIMMYVTCWQMATVAVVSSLFGFVIMFIIMINGQKYFARVQKEHGEMTGFIEEYYGGHATVMSYNAGREARKNFRVITGRFQSDALKARFYNGLVMPLMMFVSNASYVAVAIMGILLSMKDPSYIGATAVFMIYIRLFTQPLSQFAQASNDVQQTAAAAERVFEFLDEPNMPDEDGKKTAIEKIRGDVEFKNLKFAYDPETPVIKNFSATVRAGQKVAIVGPTGAGKTTLVNLLMRFYECDGGDILIDGISTRDMTRECLHDQFCMVLQDTWLFQGSVRENIKYALVNVTDEQIEEACKTVGLHHVINSLPNGYDTVLDDKTTLSSGEIQLLTIARAIIKNSPLLILDEATSNVDTRTEALVQAAMDKLTHSRTSFVIAHRLTTVKNADIIMVINGGDIVESGTHEQLLKKDGFYADLYNSQFEGKTI
jgi:ATP-binding cassette subfamily B protein